MNNIKCLRAFGLIVFVALFWAEAAYAWPTDPQWIPVPKNSLPLQDSNSDTNGSRNIVSDATHAAAFYYYDGTYLSFRTRLDQDPTGSGGQGLLKQYGWGALIDTNRSNPDYEFLVMLDGISQNETISLWKNTVQGTLGAPSDTPEVLIASTPITGEYRINLADTSINGDQDYFIDWRIPLIWMTQSAGIGINDPIRLFFGSSPSANPHFSQT